MPVGQRLVIVFKRVYPNEMSEMALAHTVSDKVEAAYRRGDMREKRRRLMADWAAYCKSPPAATKGNMVPLGPDSAARDQHPGDCKASL
jgi:hypothetical protein